MELARQTGRSVWTVQQTPMEVRSTGPPHVSILWLGVNKGMLPVKSVVGGKQGHAPCKNCGWG